MGNKTIAPIPVSLKILRNIPIPHKLGVLERLYGEYLEKLGVAWAQTSTNLTWKLDLRNPGHRWIVFGDYQGPRSMGWLRSWLKVGGTIIDSGANIGQTVLYFAPMPNTKVYAFEPFSEAAEWLEECLQQQNDWCVEVIRSGLHSEKGHLQLLVPQFQNQHGAQSTLCDDWYQNQESQCNEISVIKLDDFIEERNLSSIRLWKLDVEGWELHALQGAKNALKKNLIEAVFVEITPANFLDVKDLCEPLGYRIYELNKKSQPVPCIDVPENTGDFILLSEQ